MSGHLAGTVAVVTGAAGGIGKAVADRFEAEGAAVARADLRDADFVCDVSDESSVEALAEAVEQQLGPIGAWVNNAGITRPAMLHKMDTEDFDAVWAVNGRGTFFGIRAAARRMIATGKGGSIVNVTSSAALQGTIGQINYSAAKGAVTSMTKSAARELARHTIRVNAVAPIAATPMTEKLRTDEKLSERYLAQIPLGRFGEPDEVAEAFLYLVSTQSAFVTGQVLCVDGGLYMAS
jgi:3-oxoacyl-[acyl-carrier protein] reductase